MLPYYFNKFKLVKTTSKIKVQEKDSFFIFFVLNIIKMFINTTIHYNPTGYNQLLSGNSPNRNNRHYSNPR